MNRRDFLTITGASIVAAGCSPPQEIPHRPIPPELVPRTPFYGWGLNSLDRHTNLEPGQLCLIMGEACSGKTTLCVHAARQNIRQRGTPVFYYDLNGQGNWQYVLDDLTAAQRGRFILLTEPGGKDALERHAKDGLVIVDGSWGICRAIRENYGHEWVKHHRETAEKYGCGVIITLPLNRPPIYLGEGKVCEEYHGQSIFGALKPCDVVLKVFRDGVPGKPAVGIQILKNRDGLYGPEHIFTHRVVGRLALEPSFR